MYFKGVVSLKHMVNFPMTQRCRHFQSITVTLLCLGGLLLYPMNPTFTGSCLHSNILKRLDPILPQHNCIRIRYAEAGLRNFIICVHPTEQDKYVSGYLCRTGKWELAHSASLYKCLETAGPKATFIDIGANIGVHSLAMAAMNIAVVSVEPNPINYHRFIESIRINKFGSLIKLLPFPVSDAHRNVTMSYTRSNLGDTYVIPDAEDATLPVKEAKMFTTPTIIIDDLVRYSSKRAVIKMDIQYHECVKLRRAINLFRTLEIPCVMMEWVGQINVEKNCFNTMVSFLHEFNYTAFGLNGEELNQIKYDAWPYDVIWRKQY